jgi:L-rhamnose isomerase/sugar isomerase
MSANSPLLQAAAKGVEATNKKLKARHQKGLKHLTGELAADGIDMEAALAGLLAFDLAAPSWALGAGGTRFGRFSVPGEPTCLEEKLEDLTALRNLVGSTKSVSLHIPWDMPTDPKAIRQQAAEAGLTLAAVNSNTFQDQPGAKHSYKFGSLSNADAAARMQAIEHNIECIEIGKKLGSKALSVWLPDGGNHPGQQHFRRAADRVIDSLQKIYAKMPKDWTMYTEHKPFEPAFYSTVVSDWGASWMIAQEVGPRCLCLVDLGHHLQGCNIEQVVGYLLRVGRLGGFHFNDAKYADDDLTAGSLRPYMLFLIFTELVQGMMDKKVKNPAWTYMIDESHNIKDPVEDLCQAVDAIQRALAQALIVDYKGLEAAQANNDATMAQELLQRAFRTDVGPLVREARLRLGGAICPLTAYRAANYRALAGKTRKAGAASGL